MSSIEVKTAAIARVVSGMPGQLMGFVRVTHNSPEVRVRQRRNGWVCDDCGYQPGPRCLHARALHDSTPDQQRKPKEEA